MTTWWKRKIAKGDPKRKRATVSYVEKRESRTKLNVERDGWNLRASITGVFHRSVLLCFRRLSNVRECDGNDGRKNSARILESVC